MDPNTRPLSTPPPSETKRRQRRGKKASQSQTDPGPRRQSVPEAKAKPHTPSPVEYLQSATPSPPLSPVSDDVWSEGGPRSPPVPPPTDWDEIFGGAPRVTHEQSCDYIPPPTSYSEWYDSQPDRGPQVRRDATRDEPDAAPHRAQEGPQLEADGEEPEELERRWNEDVLVERLWLQLEQTIANHAYRREQWARGRAQLATASTSGDFWPGGGVPRPENIPRHRRPGLEVHWADAPSTTPPSTTPPSSPPLWFNQPQVNPFPVPFPEPEEVFSTEEERILSDLLYEHTRRTERMLAEARYVELQANRARQQAYERRIMSEYQEHDEYIVAREKEERRKLDFSAAERQRKQDKRESERVRQREREREKEERVRREKELEEDERRKAHEATARETYHRFWVELAAPPPPPREAAPADATPPDPTPPSPVTPQPSLAFAYLIWPLLPPFPVPRADWPNVEDVTHSGVAAFLLSYPPYYSQ